MLGYRLITALVWGWIMAKNKKLVVEFEPSNEQMDEVINKALIAQLMTTITQIGIRVDNLNDVNIIINKEKSNDN